MKKKTQKSSHSTNYKLLGDLLKSKYPRLYSIGYTIFIIGFLCLVVLGLDSYKQRFELIAKENELSNIAKKSEETLIKSGDEQYRVQESSSAAINKVDDTRKLTEQLILSLTNDRDKMSALHMTFILDKNYRVKYRFDRPKEQTLKYYDAALNYYEYQQAILDWFEKFIGMYNKDKFLSKDELLRSADTLEAATDQLERLDMDDKINYTLQVKKYRELEESFRTVAYSDNPQQLQDMSKKRYEFVVGAIHKGSYEKQIANLYAKYIISSY